MQKGIVYMKNNGYTGTISEKNGFLIKGGSTQYTIIVGENCRIGEIYASDELKRIFTLAGIRINITRENQPHHSPCIFVGETKAFSGLGLTLTEQEFKRDGFIIETVGNDYVITGVSDTGTFYAVQCFAEHVMGYTYYAPDEEKITCGDITLKEIHIREVPSFYGRLPYSHASHTDPEYGMRIRSNYRSVGPETIDTKSYHVKSHWSVLGDQSYTAQIVPYPEYGEAHPDWYGVYHGEKRFYPQLCFSKCLNDNTPGGLFDTFIHNLIERFIVPEKDKRYFMLGISDHIEYCRCENCMKEIEKYSITGLHMRMVNKIADAVEKWRIENTPERQIFLVTFAYTFIEKAPVIWENGICRPIDESVKARDNVIIRWAPINANFMYSLDDKIHNQSTSAVLEEWSTITKNFSVWDYRQDFCAHAFPFPYFLAAEKILNVYYTYGFSDIFMQAQDDTNGAASLLWAGNFAAARKLWNVRENFDELFYEFIDRYFGVCADFVREYIEILKDLYKYMESCGCIFDIHHCLLEKREYYKSDCLDKIQSVLEKALEKASAIDDLSLSVKLYDRLYPLTFFEKWVRLLNFRQEMPREKVIALLDDLEYNTQKYNCHYFTSVFGSKEDSFCLTRIREIRSEYDNI